MGVNTIVPYPGKGVAVLLGALLIVLSTTLPYLTLVNAFLFSGIIFSGGAAAWFYIIRHQVRLTYGQAFVLGAMCGLAGGVLSVGVEYFLLKVFGYRPGLESLRLLVEWGTRMAPEEAPTFRQLMDMVTAPVEITVTDLVVSMLLTGAIYAPFAGVGARIAVLILKWQARRGG
ncbi:MAG: hypothetical protein HGB01_05200 [Chlorobiaceae bacterium]|nr:hypothetical protein [Chlorobiales bacterium]NTV25588.1 hypothetical protein [Chlorobiaceae bacterium]